MASRATARLRQDLRDRRLGRPGAAHEHRPATLVRRPRRRPPLVDSRAAADGRAARLACADLPLGAHALGGPRGPRGDPRLDRRLGGGAAAAPRHRLPRPAHLHRGLDSLRRRLPAGRQDRAAQRGDRGHRPAGRHRLRRALRLAAGDRPRDDRRGPVDHRPRLALETARARVQERRRAHRRGGPMSAVWTKRRLAALAALLLPVVGTVGLIVRGELALRGSEWRFKINGHDPRDLLRGHYLTYRIDWAEQPADSECVDCCLCMNRLGDEQHVTRVECYAAESCDAWLRVGEIENLQRYYIPEDAPRQLEAAVMAGRGELVLSFSKRGGMVIKELLVDGRPWREALGWLAGDD
ncbi:MAG TPA: hypothetical protein DFS52_06135 [Myxococcales bacterium]|nr:hypothetical protein [Myxococcales bacterium]